MIRRLLGVTLLLGLLLALPADDLYAQKKKDAPAKKEIPPIDAAKLKSGVFDGTLKSVPGTDRMFTLEFEYKTLVPSGRLPTAKRPLAGVKYKTEKREIEFQLSEKAKVRALFVAEQFDDKGNPKKLTKAERAALRGKDTSLPGYESSVEKLEVGQKVRVTLAPAPTAKKPAPGTKDADEVKDVEKRRQAKLILILSEVTTPTKTSKGKDKDKKK